MPLISRDSGTTNRPSPCYSRIEPSFLQTLLCDNAWTFLENYFLELEGDICAYFELERRKGARENSTRELVISFDLFSVAPEATCNLGAAKPPIASGSRGNHEQSVTRLAPQHGISSRN